MKKLFELIRNQHSSIYRISLFVVAIIIGVYLMPRKKSFKYEPIEGKPWPHESLISDMEFSILKPADKISEEKEQIQNQKNYFFTLDQTKEVAARIKLKDELEEYISNKLESRPKLRSKTEYEKYILSIKEKINSTWGDIYKKGVIQNNGNIEGKDQNYVIYVDNGDGSSARYISDFFTINQATEQIKNINISSKEEYNEAVNILIETT